MSDERESRHDDGEDTGAVARPSGKRSARRSRSASQAETTGSVATIDRPSSKKESKADKGRGGTGNPFKRLVKFFKEVISELRKVIWPNRKQMVTYTSVVLVFVVVMVAFISGIDLAFIKGVNWLFG
ncbi:preprotein translocase subunit SecE [Nocardia sp. NPDC050406]|uniref:preprotein translocase subunit SecE n=1 Tax=Nocardia sp. NPDC050406 TaxID=3364318 RepID=UPI00378F5DCB